jgi:hypothetical protein
MFLWLILCVRYYLKCKLIPVEKDRLAKGIKCGSLASILKHARYTVSFRALFIMKRAPAGQGG